MSVKIISELGLNGFYGNSTSNFISNYKWLITLSSVAGVDLIKLQKRNPDVAVPESKKNEEKVVPWRKNPTTYLQYKKDIEFGEKEYEKLSYFSASSGTHLFSSVWDMDSAEFMTKFSPIVKIPSAKITDLDMLDYCNEKYDLKIMSTGMSMEDEVEKAVEVLDPDVIMHTNSVYPTPVEDLNLGYIQWLKEKYPKREIGYSNHYYGTKIMYVVLGMGVTWLEFHVTKDHSLWGSDQKASIEPNGLFEIVKAVTDFKDSTTQGYGPRTLFPGEEKKRESLRGA